MAIENMAVDSLLEPKVSIVMSVYNGSEALSQTLESIKAQRDVSWECIIVDDGSVDNTKEIVNKVTQGDARFRVFHQENRGLTRALIYGCQQARGEFIARHDCGDISFPFRLAEQVRYLESSPETALVSGYTQFVARGGEPLYCSEPKTHRTKIQSARDSLDDFQMPSHHGCTMFRRCLYFQVGEYRSAFYFAQDLDLWSRLVERGEHVVIPEQFYKAQFSSGSISGCYADEQRQLKRLIKEATLARRLNQEESTFLEAASKIRKNDKNTQKKRQRLAAESYFIGSCLINSQKSAAWQYLLECLAYNPLHLKGWIKLIKLSLRWV